ncbi:histone-lysine N-methyltransferase 2C-like [Pan troglodytes]|uniref:histone-lysine N-methyltransferase 2C-like n=1 Tax=Pan troglodytes TaxID=9598 RepID=UPI00020E2F00
MAVPVLEEWQREKSCKGLLIAFTVTARKYDSKGHGSGFPGKRRPRGAGLSGRVGRGRSKLKSGIGAVVLPGVSTADISSNKDDEENSVLDMVVLFSSSDKFTLNQDICVVCSSFGQGAEGRLLACSQCGQCYHPYCVSIKVCLVQTLWSNICRSKM